MVTIESAGESSRRDAAVIMTEYLQTIRDAVEPADIEREIACHVADSRSALFLARVDGAVAGCVEIHPFTGEMFEIKRLYVRESARGRGVAARLMDAAETHAARCGARKVCLDTKPSMHAAQALYRARGYHAIEPYHANHECHIMLGKDLDGAADVPAIRRATRGDAAAIARVHMQAWEESYRGILPDHALDPYDLQRRTAEWNDVLAGDACETFVAEDAGTIVGFASGAPSMDEPGCDAYLSTLYVVRSHHRKGAARALLDALFAAFRERGLHRAWLLTLRDRNPARAFYERMGAECIREQPAPALLGDGVMDVVYALPL